MTKQSRKFEIWIAAPYARLAMTGLLNFITPYNHCL